MHNVGEEEISAESVCPDHDPSRKGEYMRTIIKDAQLLELLDNYNLNEINSRIAKRIAAEERHEERILSHDIFFQMPEKTVLDLSLEEAERLLRNYENDPDHYLYEDLKQAKSIVVGTGNGKKTSSEYRMAAKVINEYTRTMALQRDLLGLWNSRNRNTVIS